MTGGLCRVRTISDRNRGDLVPGSRVGVRQGRCRSAVPWAAGPETPPRCTWAHTCGPW